MLWFCCPVPSFVTFPLSCYVCKFLLIFSLYCTHSSGICHTGLLYVQWKTPDDGHRNCPKHVELYSKNKFEKLVHLVAFILRIKYSFAFRAAGDVGENGNFVSVSNLKYSHHHENGHMNSRKVVGNEITSLHSSAFVGSFLKIVCIWLMHGTWNIKLKYFDVFWTVHHCDNWRIKNQLDATYCFIVLLIGSTCFGHYYAHHQVLVTMMLITTLVVSFLVCCRLTVRYG